MEANHCKCRLDHIRTGCRFLVNRRPPPVRTDVPFRPPGRNGSMKWLLLLLIVLVIGGVVAAILKAIGDTRFFVRRRRPSWDRARPQVRCLQCRGTGWIGREPERTLNFVGDGF